VRDRRWDFVYERQKQPVKSFILDRFADELCEELRSWPPPFVEWVSDELRRRYAEGMADRPRDEVVHFALEVARLDLARDFEAIDRLMGAEAGRHWRSLPEAAAGHLLTRYVTEKCLALKEHAEGAAITRKDLCELVTAVAGRLRAAPS
jgi:hypothetical protein